MYKSYLTESNKIVPPQEANNSSQRTKEGCKREREEQITKEKKTRILKTNMMLTKLERKTSPHSKFTCSLVESDTSKKNGQSCFLQLVYSVM